MIDVQTELQAAQETWAQKICLRVEHDDACRMPECQKRLRLRDEEQQAAAAYRVAYMASVERGGV